jgi:hypothetical protein
LRHCEQEPRVQMCCLIDMATFASESLRSLEKSVMEMDWSQML